MAKGDLEAMQELGTRLLAGLDGGRVKGEIAWIDFADKELDAVKVVRYSSRHYGPDVPAAVTNFYEHCLTR
jgi:hypothetical protein